MPKLSDAELILPTNADQRADGSLLPPLASVSAAGPGLKSSLAGLLRRSLAAEQETINSGQVGCEEDGLRFGLVITDAGRAALESEAPSTRSPPEPAGDAGKASTSKKTKVIKLLKLRGGATLDELVEATGSLPFTTRAALTGIRESGLTIDKFKRARPPAIAS